MLDSAVAGIVGFGKGPFEEPPPGVYIGYGLFEPAVPVVPAGHAEKRPMVFEDLLIAPSTEPQEFVTNVADDPVAAELSDALLHGLPPDTVVAFSARFHDSSVGAGWVRDTQKTFAPGAEIEYFKLTVEPFMIEKRLDFPPFPGGEPYSVYYAWGIADGPWVRVEAFGPPPPGDAACDGDVSSVDALLILQVNAGLLVGGPPT